MELPFILAGLWLGISAMAAHLLARRYESHWRVVPTCVALPRGVRYGSWGAGAEQSVPVGVRFAAIGAIAWGLVTGLIFAPAGMIYLAIAFEEVPLSALVLVPVVFHGFVIAVRLCGASKELFTRDREAVARTVRVSWMHHLAVVIGFGLSFRLAFFLMAAVPCIVGFAVTGLLAYAGGKLRAEG